VSFRRRAERRAPLPVAERLAAVDLIRLHAGSDARCSRASVGAGVEAIVLEATGCGNANERVVDGLREAVASGVPVVRAEAG
jgi:L-asparaginase/Glu-tRNA(Gln) amidotransferase subunit D